MRSSRNSRHAMYIPKKNVGEEDFLMGNVYEGVKKDEIVKEFKACNVYSKEECRRRRLLNG
jgi:hypothetical protein